MSLKKYTGTLWQRTDEKRNGYAGNIIKLRKSLNYALFSPLCARSLSHYSLPSPRIPSRPIFIYSHQCSNAHLGRAPKTFDLFPPQKLPHTRRLARDDLRNGARDIDNKNISLELLVRIIEPCATTRIIPTHTERPEHVWCLVRPSGGGSPPKRITSRVQS